METMDGLSEELEQQTALAKRVSLLPGMQLTERDVKILQFINDFGFCEMPQIEKLFGLVKPRSYQIMQRLVAAGLVKHERVFHGRHGIYRLTKKGASHTDLPALARITLANYNHSLAVLDVYLYLQAKHPDAEWLSERHLIHEKYFDGVGKRGHLPDGIMLMPGSDEKEQKIAIEVELRSKAKARSPIKKSKPGEIVIPVATTFFHLGKNPNTGKLDKPLIIDIMHHAGATDADKAKAYFKRYVHTVINGQLNLFARYGIVTEAHQQNTLLALDDKSELAATVLQDMHGIVVYKPGLEANKGYENIFSDKSENHLQRHPTNNMDTAIQRMLHTTFKSHLFPFAVMVSKEYNIPGTDLLNIIKAEVENTLDTAKIEHLPYIKTGSQEEFADRIEDIRQSLLNGKAFDKAMLLMLLSGDHEKILVPRGISAMDDARIISRH